MTDTTIPAAIVNELRQALQTKLGDAAGDIEAASLRDRTERSLSTFAPHFERIDEVRDALDLIGWEHEAQPQDVLLGDVDGHRAILAAGLTEAASALRCLAMRGADDEQARAVAGLAEIETLTDSLGLVAT